MTDNRPILGVTMGDPSGSGPEILVKALTLPEIRAASRPIVIGDGATMARAAAIVGGEVPVRSIERIADAIHAPKIIEVLDLHNVDLDQLQYGKVQAMSGAAAFQAIVRGVDLARSGEIAAVVTSGINKESMNLAGHHYAGHTEILADLCGVKGVCMLLVAGDFRVGHVSTHCSLKQAIERTKKPRIMEVIRLVDEATRRLGVARPRIAVAGLNPHSGEGGLFGDEDILEIAPAVEAARAEGFDVSGPVPPDTVFFRMKEGQYDAVVAMYHDQGHIPTKVLAFDTGVNVTLGLPIIRTSVDHGTVFGKAGKGTAKPDSMVEALKLAATMAAERHR
jgi:4-phospho-D-threonate 3-dehydrogenase / 4-phospho-D-erythronate 3-dehydrogenase